MSPTIRGYLEFLYGTQHASVHEELSRLLVGWAAHPDAAALGTSVSLTERDALLIAYPDHVREPGSTPLRTLSGFAGRHLSEIVSGIHLLPFYPASSDDGFSVMDYAVIDPAFGDWNDVRAFRPAFDLMFDAVFNHASAQGEWFRRSIAGDPDFDSYFFAVEGDPDLRQVVRPRTLPLLTEFDTHAGRRRFWTTFSADQVDLDFRNPRVLLKMVEMLLLYVRNGARFIRLDAVTFLWKEVGTPCVHLPQTHAIIQLFRAVVDEVAPGVVLVTETNVPHQDNVSYFGDGTNEAQMVYNFALPGLVIHAVTTGRAGPLTRWARSLQAPSDQVTFFNFLASHDGIGLNGVRGILNEDEIDALVRRAQACGGFVSYKLLPDGGQLPYELNANLLDFLAPLSEVADSAEAVNRFLAAHAAMLSLRGVPGLYFHSVMGSRGDREGALASGIHRRINRQKVQAAELEAALASPDSLPARVHAGFQRLMRARRAHPAFHPCGPQDVLSLDERVFAVRRRSPDGTESVLCLQNLSGDMVPIETGEDGGRVRAMGGGVDLFTGSPVEWGGTPGNAGVLEPWETQWLRIGED